MSLSTFRTITGLTFALLGLLVCPRHCASLERLKPDQAVGKAYTEARRLGYDPDQMLVDVDEQNTKWLKFINSSSDAFEASREVRTQLTGRDYLAIYFKPKPEPNTAIMGGDLFVFIDRVTGDVITVVQFP